MSDRRHGCQHLPDSDVPRAEMHEPHHAIESLGAACRRHNPSDGGHQWIPGLRETIEIRLTVRLKEA